MVLNCPHCGKRIQDEDAVYCPYCSKLIKELPYKKTGFPIAGGILTIIAACICIFLGIVGLLGFASSFGYYYYGGTFGLLFMGIFGILGFAFGLTGGIMALRRKNFILAIVGISFTLLSGFVTILGLATMGYGNIITGVLFGIPIIILSVLGLIFVAMSKQEFG